MIFEEVDDDVEDDGVVKPLPLVGAGHTHNDGPGVG